jgi:hypothetical protein
MNEKKSPATDTLENDPSAELGLRSPVRDKERLGDEKYNVTPPRDAVRPPEPPQGGGERCSECSAPVDPKEALRSDAKEYSYYFCDTGCRDRWQRQRDSTGNR